MKKVLTPLLVFIAFAGQAQSLKDWQPKAIADTTYPRSIIHTSEIAGVKAALAAGKNIDLYHEVYQSALSTPPVGNEENGDRRQRGSIAKNAAFAFLLGVKPSGQATAPLNTGEQNLLKTKAITLLEELNTFVHQITPDSPYNFDEWQWTSKEVIEYISAYDLLKGAGVTNVELKDARKQIRTLAGNLYKETTKSVLGTSFYQGAKNNHALMSTGALGLSAVILSDVLAEDDTAAIYNPVNWFTVAMWNTHNVMWWDIKKQSVPGKYAGYAEGTHYFRYAFCNLLPFFRSVGWYLKDTSVYYEFNSVNRRLRNPWYDTNYVMLYDWIEAIRFPDGRMPPLEDSYTYECFPELAILRNPKYAWPLHLSGLDPVQNNSLSEQLQSTFDLRANYIAANVTYEGQQDTALFKAFPDAGIAVFRSSWDSSAHYLALLGKNGPALFSSDAHNQADEASFMIAVNGQMMAIDPGYLNYVLRDSLGISMARGHNMILVDGEGTEPGRPGNSGGANAYIEKYFQSPVQHYAEVRTAYQGAGINRKVMHVRNKYFLLIDHMSAATPKQFTWLLHGYGLKNGDPYNTGVFIDMFDKKRAAWQRRNSGLYAYINSDQSFSLSHDSSLHEYRYAVPQYHTVAKANSLPTTGMSYMTCLQPFHQNIAADTFPVITLDIPGTVAYKVVDGQNTDVAVSKSFSNAITVDKSVTGLTNTYATDAQLLWVSEKSGSLQDLFMYKGTALKKDNDTLVTASKPVNIQYLQTGPKSYKGYVGDTGAVNFYSVEYPYSVKGDGIWWVKYDSVQHTATIYFGLPTAFTMDVDNTKLSVTDINRQQHLLSAFPNPASDLIRFTITEMLPANVSIELFDITGKVVKQQHFSNQQREFVLSVDDLNTGIYFARMIDTKGNTSKAIKVMVAR